MITSVTLANRGVGPAHPVFIIAEIGINHNGSLELAKKLIDAAALAGCDAVKFQKRTPELCVPQEQRSIMRETPWGMMTYMAYRERMEFDAATYAEISSYCQQRGMLWFTSCWDVGAVEFMEQFDPCCYKIASATLTDFVLLDAIAATGRPVILSTGMSTMEQIRAAVARFRADRLLIAHATSTYPCMPDELNLRMIETLRAEFPVPIGYSGHEVGLQTTYAAVVLGACFIERHITLDRALWGSDQAASIEPSGFIRLVRDVRIIEQSMGDGIKRVYDSERPAMTRLRK